MIFVVSAVVVAVAAAAVDIVVVSSSSRLLSYRFAFGTRTLLFSQYLILDCVVVWSLAHVSVQVSELAQV